MSREILLVEDDPDDAELFRVAAAETGFPAEITLAASGEEALELLAARRAPPALILLDLKMPGLGGLDVLRRLRRDPVLKRARVIVLTSSDLESDRAEAAALGCIEYIVKPASLDGYLEIARRIEDILARAPD